MDGLLEFAFNGIPTTQVGKMVEHIVESVSNIESATYSEMIDDLDFNLVVSYDFWKFFASQKIVRLVI